MQHQSGYLSSADFGHIVTATYKIYDKKHNLIAVNQQKKGQKQLQLRRQ